MQPARARGEPPLHAPAHRPQRPLALQLPWPSSRLALRGAAGAGAEGRFVGQAGEDQLPHAGERREGAGEPVLEDLERVELSRDSGPKGAIS